MKGVDLSLIIPKASYVVAVSGGVDSVVLLDMLVQELDRSLLTVAHFDHGIRNVSADDEQFVRQLAKKHGCNYISSRVELGEHCSEERARKERYLFLDDVQKNTGARGLILAHHQDDVIETAIINILRGTGPRGLASLQSTRSRIRPLLGLSKEEIIEYAKDRNLTWVEDATNTDESYLRNRVRSALKAHSSKERRDKLLDVISTVQNCMDEITTLCGQHIENSEISRLIFTALPYNVRTVLCTEWLRYHGVTSFNRRQITRLTTSVCTLESGKRVDIFSGTYLTSNLKTVTLHVKQ